MTESKDFGEAQSLPSLGEENWFNVKKKNSSEAQSERERERGDLWG